MITKLWSFKNPKMIKEKKYNYQVNNKFKEKIKSRLETKYKKILRISQILVLIM